MSSFSHTALIPVFFAFDSLGENLCLMCLQAPKMAHSHFCSQTCVDDAENKGPMVLEVPYGHSTFKNGM